MKSNFWIGIALLPLTAMLGCSMITPTKDYYVSIDNEKLIYDQKRNGPPPNHVWMESKPHNLHLTCNNKTIVYRDIGSDFFSTSFSFMYSSFDSFRIVPQKDVLTLEQSQKVVQDTYNFFIACGFKAREYPGRTYPHEFDPRKDSSIKTGVGYTRRSFSVQKPEDGWPIIRQPNLDIEYVNLFELEAHCLDVSLGIKDLYLYQGRQSASEARYKVAFSVGPIYVKDTPANVTKGCSGS
jgi:hypothetical protein